MCQWMSSLQFRDVKLTVKLCPCIVYRISQRYIYSEFLTDIIAKHDPATPLALFYAPHVAHCPLQVPKAAYEKFSFMTDDEGQCSAQTVKGVHTIDPHFPDLEYKCRQQYKAMVRTCARLISFLTNTWASTHRIPARARTRLLTVDIF
jgi:hypothetical protein